MLGVPPRGRLAAMMTSVSSPLKVMVNASTGSPALSGLSAMCTTLTVSPGAKLTGSSLTRSKKSAASAERPSAIVCVLYRLVTTSTLALVSLKASSA